MLPIFKKFGIRGQLTDVIMCVKFLVDRFRGYGVLIPPKFLIPIDLLHRTYTSVALPCDTVIVLFLPITQLCSVSNVLFTGGRGISDFSVLKI